MANAFVQSVGESFTGASTGQNISVTVGTAGNLLALAIYWDSTTITLQSIDDTKSNSWTILDNPVTHPATTRRAAQAYAKNCSSGATTVTAHFSAAVDIRSMLHEVSGPDTTAPEDGHDLKARTAPGTGTDALTTAAVTTTANGDYIFGWCCDVDNASNQSTGTGFTSRIANTASEDQIQTSAGSIAVTFTEPDGGGSHNFVGIMAFKAAGAGGAATVWPATLTMLGVQ